jgi:hypothetical protein
MGWIDKDDFVEFVASILTNPVRVKNTKVAAFATNTLLGNRFVGSGLLDLALTTGVAWLTIDTTLLDWSFTATSADANSVDDETLLSLVAKLAGLVWAGWSCGLMDDSKLSVFPGSDSEHESEKVRLLLPPNFFQILVIFKRRYH